MTRSNVEVALRCTPPDYREAYYGVSHQLHQRLAEIEHLKSQIATLTAMLDGRRKQDGVHKESTEGQDERRACSTATAEEMKNVTVINGKGFAQTLQCADVTIAQIHEVAGVVGVRNVVGDKWVVLCGSNRKIEKVIEDIEALK
jgi:hypothetical protein